KALRCPDLLNLLKKSFHELAHLCQLGLEGGRQGQGRVLRWYRKGRQQCCRSRFNSAAQAVKACVENSAGPVQKGVGISQARPFIPKARWYFTGFINVLHQSVNATDRVRKVSRQCLP